MEASDNRDYQGVLKEWSEDVIPAPVEPQGQIPDEEEAYERPKIPARNPTPMEPHGQIPGEEEAYERPKIPAQNPGYAALRQNRRRSTADEDFYQKLRKQVSDYVYTSSRETRVLRRHQNGKKLTRLHGIGSEHKGKRRKSGLCSPKV